MKKIIVALALLISPFLVSAEQMNANELIKKNIATTKGFVDSYETIKMTIRKKNGNQVERLMKSKSLEVDGDGNKVIMVFQDPADVKGSAVLTHSHIQGNDDQWVYLPALKRVKRISSSNKSGPFMGSDFAYEDLSSVAFEKFTYKYLGEALDNGKKYYKVERVPAYERSGYSKQIVWINNDNYVIDKIELFDNAGKVYKTQLLLNYVNYFGNFWRAKSIEMHNHQNGNSTLLEWVGDIEFNNGFSDRDFRKDAMKR
ncbi:outer membrane lipoprotein-sorting protein [Photobacterium kishitanii]|uniref:outer membrane lipoprotein-sorting protein n=1 Tax=Photobacterium kishitanii TaxID=318456 RepID=UPI000D1629C0|nr:outer membrane lipoprotein-sorting protein [Photobacterium kishitanii]PSU21383.1 outer membrane lipoprotein-sorting protein [Photobacterium kishitanii]PSW63259.1 outer membrane lipoprotein-sorting protein [Photobacterium kishitanii]